MSYVKPDILYDYSQRYLSARQQRYLAHTFAHPLINKKNFPNRLYLQFYRSSPSEFVNL